MHYLVVLEEEERLHEGEEKMHDVDENEDVTLARFVLRVLKVGGDMETVQCYTAERKR